MVRIAGEGGVLPPAAKTWALDMVRGEREGFQCALRPEEAGAKHIPKVSLSVKSEQALVATIYRVLAVNHAAPPTEGMFIVPPRRLGAVPAVLLPLVGHAEKISTPGGIGGPAPLTFYVDF